MGIQREFELIKSSDWGSSLWERQQFWWFWESWAARVDLGLEPRFSPGRLAIKTLILLGLETAGRLSLPPLPMPFPLEFLLLLPPGEHPLTLHFHRKFYIFYLVLAATTFPLIPDFPGRIHYLSHCDLCIDVCICIQTISLCTVKNTDFEIRWS